MENITLNEFRDILDSFNLTYRRQDNKLLVPMKDEELGEDPVFVVFGFEGENSNKIQMIAMSPGFGASMSEIEKLRFCNAWNRDKVFPKAFVGETGGFVLEVTIYNDEEISKEYIRKYFVALAFMTSVEFFKELKKSL